MTSALKKISPKYIFLLIYVPAIFLLLKSVISAGIYYQYDIDELFHINLVYLYSRGYLPFNDLFTIHSPVFHFLLLPFMKLYGFDFEGIYKARILMSAIFILRIIVSVLIVRKIFGLKTAIFFLPLFLLDPLSNFSSIQIRPDNLMILSFSIGFLLIISRSKTCQFFIYFLSGIFLSLSVIISFKCLPSVLTVILLSILIFRIRNKALLYIIFGILTPLFLFYIYFFSINLHKEMLTQLFLDANLINNSILNPGKIPSYFKANNIFIYGIGGKTLIWYYLISLPVLTSFGLLAFFAGFYTHKKDFNYSKSGIILASILIIQTIFLFVIYSVFIQYFLPISWLLAAFTAFLITWLIRVIKNKIVNFSFLVVIITLTSLLIQSGITGNNLRAKFITNTHDFTKTWQIIPENEPVFPNTLFRPLSYPITYGAFLGDIPPQILKKLPKISDSLEKQKVKFLLLNKYTMNFLPPQEQKYIMTNYNTVNSEDGLRILK